MKLTPFGLCVRKLRVDYGLTLQQMGSEMRTTAAYLSAMETGKKELTEKHANAVFDYFYRYANATEKENVRSAIATAVDQTVNIISLRELSPENKRTVCLLVRQLRGLK